MLKNTDVVGVLQQTGLLALVVTALLSGIATAATITVTNTADSGAKSLRQALAAAASGDTISITAKGTLTLTSGELLVDKSVNIQGPGAGRLIVSGGGLSRVFHITPNTVVAISGLTISNGSVSIESGDYFSNAGGGIFNDHADLTLDNCVVSGNSARFGGGIFSDSQFGGNSTVTISNSTIRDNSAQFGGGILSGGGFANTGPSGDAILRISDSSIDNNSAGFGGGIFNDGLDGSATMTITNTVISTPAPSPSALGAFGAAVYNNGDSGSATATLVHCTVSGKPFEFGGDFTSGLYNDGSSSISPGNAAMTLTDSVVSGNSGFGGSGIVNGGSDSGSAVLTLNGSTVSGNAGPGLTNLLASATVNSGTFSHNAVGVTNAVGTLTLNDSTVSENSGGFAGGISNAAGGSATLNRSTVIGNGGNGISNDCAVLKLSQSTVSKSSGVGVQSLCTQDQLSTAATVRDSTVSENSGGIFDLGGEGASATFTLINSTVSSNAGIGIYTSGVDGGNGLLILKDSTLSGNVLAPGFGASGIQNISLGGSATVEITNTILNADASGSIGSTGTVISHGYNLSSDGAGGLLNGPGDIVNTDPLLGPLKNNGGLTKTHALLSGSPAIDAGDPNFDANAFSPPLIFDQRDLPGFLRIVNGRIDIGAYESKRP